MTLDPEPQKPLDGTSIQAGPVLLIQCSPKQTTSVTVDPYTQKSTSLLITTNVNSPPPCSELPFEKLESLAIWLEAIPDVSSWFLETIERGYSLQFTHRPPRFRGIIQTKVRDSNAHVLHFEVQTLLAKGAMEMVPLVNSESGFYSHYFLVPKKDGGLRPILDLRHLNRLRMRRPFKMLSLKQILGQTCKDWFLSGDLKHAYFHIQMPEAPS